MNCRLQCHLSQSKQREAMLAMRSVFAERPWPALLGAIGNRYKEVTNEVLIEQGLALID